LTAHSEFILPWPVNCTLERFTALVSNLLTGHIGSYFQNPLFLDACRYLNYAMATNQPNGFRHDSYVSRSRGAALEKADGGFSENA
jgi:hypothetical protein